MARLATFVQSHNGVEGFVEPRTMVTETTLVLVADTGEWTRRRIAGPEAAFAFGREHSVPVYDVTKSGYPSRMREWNRNRVPRERDGT